MIGHATDLTCAGELHQIAARISRSRSERDYLRIIRGKTGQLFGLSFRLGARAAAADTRLQALLQIAGIELGMAFQIADDILDLTGQQEKTGKDTGNDLANARLTLPLLRALQSASPTERNRIEALLQTPNTESHFELCQHPDIHRGISSSHNTAGRFVDSCLTRIKYMSASRERDLLAAIARFAIQRQL